MIPRRTKKVIFERDDFRIGMWGHLMSFLRLPKTSNEIEVRLTLLDIDWQKNKKQKAKKQA